MGDIADVGTMALGGTGLIALIGMIIKFIILDGLKGKSAAITIAAGDTMMARLQSEIARLEGIIRQQREDYEATLARAKRDREDEIAALRRQVHDLEERIDVIHSLELQDAADIAELTILLDTFCRGCTNDDGVRSRIKAIIGRIRERKGNGQRKPHHPEPGALNQ